MEAALNNKLVGHILTGNMRGLQKMLQNSDVDPAYSDSRALCAAVTYNQSQAVRILVADGRVDAAFNANEFLWTAAVAGSVEVAKELLVDERVRKGAEPILEWASNPESMASEVADAIRDALHTE